ncbi:Microprocessor complex subunit dgcr8 [Mactra antiquata]
MDDQGEESPFSSEALSFDSTLDSLLDGNFITVDKTINIEVEPSQDILMPAQESITADISQKNDGENDVKMGLMNVDTFMELHKSMDQINDGIDIGKDDQSITNRQESVSLNQLPTGLVDNICPVESLTSTETTRVVNTVSNSKRCNSPDFGKIKEKRKRNMKKNSCHSKDKLLTNEDGKVKNHRENIGEPEAKRRKSNKTENDAKCPYEFTAEGKKSIKGSKNSVKENKSSAKEKKKSHKESKKSTIEKQKTAKEIKNSVQGNKESAKEIKKSDELLKTSVEMKTNTDNDVKKIADHESIKTKTTPHDNIEMNKLDEQCRENTAAEVVGVVEAVSVNDDELNDTLVPDTDMKQDTAESLNDFNVESDNVVDDDDYDDENDDVVTDDDDDDEEYVDDDEIHGWLEEGVTKPMKKKICRHDLKDGEFLSRDKHVLEEKGVNPFEVLPTGWVMITHDSGMPVYLHKSSRVCTFSRPYFIGSGSSRKHDIPLSSIPCLQYRREIQKEENINNDIVDEKLTENNTENTELNDNDLLPKATLKSAEETDKLVSIGPNEFNTYCRGLFKFKVVKVKRFKTWREKRAHIVQEQKKKESQLPKLAADTKLITCPIPPDNTTKKSKKKEFVMNPEGKTAVCILHEYTQNVLRVQPTYEFREVQNAESPFQATVVIAGIQYGSGCASGKRQAKNEAAKATLSIFLPELSPHLEGSKGKPKDELSSDLKYFEDVSIEDSRVPDLCNKASLPQPYQVLQTCLQRNFGLGDTTLKTDKKLISNQKTEFTMTVGKRTCTVVCKNKREAKQKAAQVMLQQLHPDLKNWAAMLRLYSKNNEVGYLEREDDDMAVSNFHMEKKKNLEILDKLKSAMRKIKEQRKQFSDGNSIPAVVPAQPLSL